MGYILGVCGVVLGGSLLIYFVYSFYSKRYDLDNGAINAKEDRFYGNVDLEDYEDDDRVEVFEDILDLAKQAEDEEFDKAVEEINKFVARRNSMEEQSSEQLLNVAGQEVVENNSVVQEVVAETQDEVIEEL